MEIRRYLVDPETGCWNWTGVVSREGYGRTTIKGQWQSKTIHRLAWENANGPIPAGLLVCHRCDNRRCCNPDHLFLGTSQDNSDDMRSKGRSAYGERHPQARLTEALAAEILISSEPNRTLAKRYGVPEYLISNVRHGISWGHVSPELPRRATGVPRTPLALAERRARVLELRSEGLPTEAIAAQVGVNRTCVSRYLRTAATSERRA
jgi:hypothetical protein